MCVFVWLPICCGVHEKFVDQKFGFSLQDYHDAYLIRDKFCVGCKISETYVRPNQCFVSSDQLKEKKCGKFQYSVVYYFIFNDL